MTDTSGTKPAMPPGRLRALASAAARIAGRVVTGNAVAWLFVAGLGSTLALCAYWSGMTEWAHPGEGSEFGPYPLVPSKPPLAAWLGPISLGLAVILAAAMVASRMGTARDRPGSGRLVRWACLGFLAAVGIGGIVAVGPILGDLGQKILLERSYLQIFAGLLAIQAAVSIWRFLVRLTADRSDEANTPVEVGPGLWTHLLAAACPGYHAASAAGPAIGCPKPDPAT